MSNHTLNSIEPFIKTMSNSFKKYTLVTTNSWTHVSMDLYQEFEAQILASQRWCSVSGPGQFSSRIIRNILKFVYPFQLPIKKNECYLVVGYHKEKFFPYFHYKTPIKSLWMYDAWENRYEDIEKSIVNYGINILFVSSSQSAKYFSNRSIGNFEVHWVPEAVNILDYKQIDYNKRKIDLIQFGRKWESHHEKIKVLEKEFVYLYQKDRNKVIFKKRADFIAALANSKISICVPSDITHPERSGSVSTMTNRYLQSMASKCLILGKAPKEMIVLFGYNPIVEIDDVNPINQIRDLLVNYDSYLELIEKNYQMVKNNHQWSNRIQQIEELIGSWTIQSNNT